MSVASFANIFSHSVGCLFVLFMVSFALQKLFRLIRCHLFIFGFLITLKEVDPKRYFCDLCQRMFCLKKQLGSRCRCYYFALLINWKPWQVSLVSPHLILLMYKNRAESHDLSDPFKFYHYRHTSEILWIQFQASTKANIATERVTWIFWCPNAHKSYIYTILWSIKCTLCLKKYTA